MFEPLSLNFFCTIQEEVYPCVWSNFTPTLIFPTRDRFTFALEKHDFIVSANSLAKLIHHPVSKFKRIHISSEAYSFIMESNEPIYHDKISLSMLPLKVNMIYKIVIMCLRLKSSSANDVSRYEAQLLCAIMNGFNFPITHFIMLHMHRVTERKSGKLPYGAPLLSLCILKASLPLMISKPTCWPMVRLAKEF